MTQRTKKQKTDKKKKKKKDTPAKSQNWWDDVDDDDFDQRMADQAKQGDKKGGGKKTCLDFSKHDKEVKWFKLTKGEKYKLNILPFPVSKEWYKDLRQQAGPPTGRKIGKPEYALIIPVHSYIGTDNKTVLCIREAFGRKCPVCDLMFDKYKEDSEANAKIISNLRAKWKCYYNVKVKGEEGVQLWEMTFGNFEKALRVAQDASETGSVSFAKPNKEGKWINFKAHEATFGARKYLMVERVDFSDRKKPIPDEQMEEVVALDEALIIPTTEEVENIFLEADSGTEEVDFPPTEDDDDDDDDDTPVEDTDDDDDEDDDVVKQDDDDEDDDDGDDDNDDDDGEDDDDED